MIAQKSSISATRPAVSGRAAFKTLSPRVGGVTSSARSSTKMQASNLPIMTLADGFNAYLAPYVEQFSTMDLPPALVHWGHPGNMLVVLLAMGGYGAVYLGWAIRTSDNAELVAKAKSDHPKIAGIMTLLFAAGATGGMLSLLLQGKPIFESTHVLTGLGGLGLLGVQACLPLFFDKGARDIHAYLGTSIMALFVVHAGLGIQLGLSLP